MNGPTRRIGSQFSLGSVSHDDLPRLLHHVRHHASSRISRDRQRQILEAWIGLCGESHDGVVDRDTLCEHLDITRPGLIHHLKALERLGMVQRSERRPDSTRRRVVCYELCVPAGPAPAPEIPDLFDTALVGIGDAATARREETDALQALFRRADSVTCAPAAPDKTTFKGERLTVFTLAPALNVGRREVTTKTTRIWRRIALVRGDRQSVDRASHPERTRSASVRGGVDARPRSASAPRGQRPGAARVRDLASDHLPADGIRPSQRQQPAPDVQPTAAVPLLGVAAHRRIATTFSGTSVPGACWSGTST